MDGDQADGRGHRGAREGELWIHAAYSGHLKTTFALNWAYNQAVIFHAPVLYFSLEMPYHQVRRWLLAMHSFHSKFAGVRTALGIQQGRQRTSGSTYKRIREHKLTPAEKQFLVDYVVPDWDDPRKPVRSGACGGRQPGQPRHHGRRAQAARGGALPQTSFGMVVVDHATLVGARSRSTSTTERLTDAMRDLKRFAMQFRRGQDPGGRAVPDQPRGSQRPTSARRRPAPLYDLHNLANAAEAERSADVVTASYLDKEGAERNRALFTCLRVPRQRPLTLPRAD